MMLETSFHATQVGTIHQRPNTSHFPHIKMSYGSHKWWSLKWHWRGPQDVFKENSKKLFFWWDDDDFTAVFSDAISTDKQTFYHGTRSWMVVELAPYLTWWKQVVQHKSYSTGSCFQTTNFLLVWLETWQEKDYLTAQRGHFWWIF